MELSSSLLIKAIGGLAVASTVTTVGVLKKDSIATALGLKSDPQKEESASVNNVKGEVNKKLIEYLKTDGKDIVFKVYKEDSGETEPESNFFDSFSGNKTVRFVISTKTTSSLTGDSDGAKSKELKDLLGTTGDLIWECKINFNKTGNGTTWKAEEKDIFYKNGSGFYQKITASGNRLLKERFIRQCSELSKGKENIVDGSIKLGKQFNLIEDKTNLTIKEKEDYQSWFGLIELTKKEVKAIKDKWDFTLKNDSNELVLADIVQGNEKISGCRVTLSGDGASSKSGSALNSLGKLFNNDSYSVNQEKYREGFLKKCRNSDNSMTLTLAANDDLNQKLKELFDFSREYSRKFYENMRTSGKSIAVEGKTAKITVVASSNDSKEKYECKIVATTKNSEVITEEQKTKIKNEVSFGWGVVVEATWKNFLKSCRGVFNDEVEKTLNKKTNQNNEYDIFAILPSASR